MKDLTCFVHLSIHIFVL